MRLITLDDIIDTYAKSKQRGVSFIASKFNFSGIKRTKSTFNELNTVSANWWIIPEVKKRWNLLITGDKNMEFEEFLVKELLKDTKGLKMLSIGSGICDHELKFASFDNFEEILCLDINEVLFDEAKKIANQKELKNIKFKLQNIYEYDFPENYFDIVFFHHSLHHFKNIDQLVGQKIKQTLKEKGVLVIDEFVGPNRLQFPKHQIKAVNQSLQLIPKKYRKRYLLNFYKNKIYGSGVLRVILADPSECVESESIIPAVHRHLKPIYETPYGGNILANTLKDIAHHFVDLDPEKEKVLKELFEFENQYLKEHSSDFVFGVYQKE
ncbi:methyltransferase domain-containing protein [Aquimarina sp. MMG016]|uniref:class I SAM-dependent methyltransferase n=1 Tax=Aquimarina sp. MMG016 TaxID=2822690 RepID=UPI001B3A6C0A|nr:methyltransferase domain-containing protein [Aquimarina sp. MMG016]MBQ4822190.1 methyltransferase domain-containing protein [Aquimarina sp. MMG016]